MAHRSSNRRRNAWAVSLLEVRPDDRVLEIGFGPGLATRELSRIAHEGYVCGIDHSELMLRQATRRNAEGVGRGLVDLRLGSVDALPAFDRPFDKVLAVNVLMFWNESDKRLEALRRLLRRGGGIAVAHQPRGPGATDATSVRPGDRGGACPRRILRGAGRDPAPEARGRVRARGEWSGRVIAPPREHGDSAGP
jgi:SAM-dependent methyltransferase